ncbi:hypothetical protein COM62_08115 [Bacillus pseudomycoides]|nr:hypothetical protein COM62_08115 [Bacillus pseudomycoides]
MTVSSFLRAERSFYLNFCCEMGIIGGGCFPANCTREKSILFPFEKRSGTPYKKIFILDEEVQK